MKIIGVIIGLISGAMTGTVIGLFSGNIIKDALICSSISALISLIFFKSEIIQTGSKETDELFDSYKSKIIMSNSWVFWIGNFSAALIVNAIERQDYFWSAFISCSLSVIIAMTVTGISASFFGKHKT